jgi:hypothetical protein
MAKIGTRRSERSDRTEGTGVDCVGPPRRAATLRLVAFASLLAVAILAASVAHAATAPEFLLEVCEGGNGAGQCNNTRGLATDPANGHVFVAQSVERISEFTSWGGFVKAWGGSGDGGGQFNRPNGLAVDGVGDVYVVDRNNHRIQKFDPTGGVGEDEAVFDRAWGWNVVESGPDQSDEVQAVTVRATEGQFTLSFEGEETGNLEWNDSAAEVEAALNALTSINAGGGSVSVSGGPGDEEGTSPYEVTFDGGPLAGADVPELVATDVSLSGGDPASEAAVATVNPGETGFEVCVAENGDICQEGEPGPGRGQFGNGRTGAFIGVDSADRVYVGDDNRIEKFDSEGAIEPEIEVPDCEFIESLAVDSVESHIYVSCEKHEKVVRQLSLAGTEEGSYEVSGDQVGALATDTDGDVYVVNGTSDPEVLALEPDLSTQLFSFGEGEFDQIRAIATGSVCRSEGADVYLGNAANPDGHVRAYGPFPECEPPPPIPPEIVEGSEQATGVGTTTATLEAEIDPNFWDTEYLVEYGPADCSANPCETAPVPPALLSGEERGATPVQVELTGLAPGSLYHYRFLATSHCNAAEPAEQCTAEGADRAFRTYLTQPGVLPDGRGYEMVSPPQKNSAELGAPIAAGGEALFSVVPQQAAPGGERVTYHSATAFGDGVESAPAASQYTSLRGGGGWSTDSPVPLFQEGGLRDPFVGFSPDLAHAAEVSFAPSLTPEATGGFWNLYRRDAGGTFTALTTESHRPDLGSTPAEKYCLAYGGASHDFDHVFFSAKAALIDGDPTANEAFNLYEWSNQATDARQTLTVSATGGEYSLTATFATGGALHTETTGPIAATANAATVRATLEALPSIGSGNVSVSGGPGDAAGSSPYQVSFTGALAAAYVRTLTANDISLSGGGAEATVAVVEHGGHLRLASVLPDGSAAEPTTTSGFGRNGAQLTCNMSTSLLRHAISADGSKAFWSYPGAYPAFTEPPFTFVSEPLLARVDGSQTIELDAAQPGSFAANLPFPPFAISGLGKYQDATPDGSRVFFTDQFPLTVTAGVGSNHLYMYDFNRPEGEELLDLTPNGGGSAEVQGVIGASEAGDYVFFTASAALTPPSEENEAGEHAEAGESNLYLWREAEGGPEIRFIAQAEALNATGRPDRQQARVSPDGRWLAFVSQKSLTGYDNTIGDGSPACALTSEGEPSGGPDCREAFVYSASADRLDCASCNPSGARPIGPPAENGETSFPTWSTPYQQPRYLGDGGRTFFMSRDALAPRDVNQRQDVYQWEPAGTGACTEADPSFSPQNRGCVDLITTGESADDSYLIDASASGEDVFLSTRQRLTWSDEDERFDVYDARVGGGFPEPPPPPVCEGEGCREGSTSAGPLPSAGTSPFHGAGNPPSRRNCKPAARRAKKLSGRAKKLRRHANQAKRNGKSAVAKHRRRKSTHLAKRARKKSKSAKRCRRANRRAAR